MAEGQTRIPNLTTANANNLINTPEADEFVAFVRLTDGPNGPGYYGKRADGTYESVSQPKGDAGSITAGTTQTQAGATPITAGMNFVTVNNPNDGIRLPAAVPNEIVYVYNSSATNPVQVYGTGTDTVNGQSNTPPTGLGGVSQPSSSIDIYVCPVAGQWVAEVGGGFAAGMFTESSRDNIIANSVAAGAPVILGQTARIISVTNAGAATPDAIILPPSKPGLEILVINHAINAGVNQPITVLGSGADQIDDLAAATGVVQMQRSMVIYSCSTAGNWYTNGIGTGFSGSLPTVSSTNNITAFSGGGQGSAILLTTALNRVTTVGAAGDSVKLPAAFPGLLITVANAAALNSMNLFPNTGDSINALAANTAFAIPAGKTAQLSCYNQSPGNWHAVLSA